MDIIIDPKALAYNLAKYEKDDPDTFGWTFERSCGYRCNSCNADVSPAVVKFFNYQPVKILCIACQNKTKTFNK